MRKIRWLKTFWLLEVRQDYFQAPQLGLKHIKEAEEDHKHMCHLLTIWINKAAFKTCMSTKSSSAPEQKTLQANLEVDNISLGRVSNWIDPCTEISSVKPSLNTWTLTLLKSPTLKNALRAVPSKGGSKNTASSRMEDFSSRISVLMSKKH